MKVLFSMGAVCVALTGAWAAPGDGEFRTDINPALLYYRALVMPVEPLSDADHAYLVSKQGREQPLPERFGKIVAGSESQFFLVRRAVQARVACDWGLDLSDGPKVLLPHLGRARALCQTAQLRAAWALQHGAQSEARDDLLGAFVLGRNAASDGLLISAFVQFTIESLDYGTIAQHYGEFAPDNLRELVEGFAAAPARHTIAGCMASEKEMGNWTLHQVLRLQQQYPGDDAKVMAGFQESGIVEAMKFVGETNFWPRLLAASGGTSAGVIKLLHESEAFFPRCAEIMTLPPAEFELRAKQLSTELQQSRNPFIAGFKIILAWDNRRFRETEFKVEAQLAMVQAATEYKRRGESGLKSVRDPFGAGPLEYARFKFKGVDRGFQLKSAYPGADGPFVMIFVEKSGPAFQVIGPDAGKPITQ